VRRSSTLTGCPSNCASGDVLSLSRPDAFPGGGFFAVVRPDHFTPNGVQAGAKCRAVRGPRFARVGNGGTFSLTLPPASPVCSPDLEPGGVEWWANAKIQYLHGETVDGQGSHDGWYQSNSTRARL